MRRKNVGEGAGEEKSSLAFERRRYEEPFASIVEGVVRRFISTPIKAKGAQQAKAQGIPQMLTIIVAILRLRTKGAIHMAPAKMIWLNCQAVRRSGLRLLIAVTKGAKGPRKAGGRGVKGRERDMSGDLTMKGRRMDAMKVMMEKMTSEREPTRPTSPRASLEADALVSGW